MDPAAAAAMWEKMPAAQRESAQAMMKNMDPAVLANMAKSMGMPEVSEAQAREAQQKASFGNMERDAALMASQQAGQADYMLAGAETRKQKANALFKQGKFNEAVDMYDAILTNLATIPKSKSSKSAPIVKACRLNMARCKLETKEYPAVIKHCDVVLATQPGDLKALYRRGLAREGLGHLDQSIVDFETALKSNPGDGGADVQRALDRVSAAREKAAADGKITGMTESEKAEETAAAAAVVSAPLATPGFPGMPGGITPEMMEAMKNPDMMRQAQEQMKNMDPDVMASMMKAQGMDVNKDQMQAATKMMSSLGGDEMSAMMDMASKIKQKPGQSQNDAMQEAMKDPETREKMMGTASKVARNFGNTLVEDPAALGTFKDQANPEQIKKAGEQMGYTLSDRQSSAVSYLVKGCINMGMVMLYVWKAIMAVYVIAFADKFRSAMSALLLALLIAWFFGFDYA